MRAAAGRRCANLDGIVPLGGLRFASHGLGLDSVGTRRAWHLQPVETERHDASALDPASLVGFDDRACQRAALGHDRLTVDDDDAERLGTHVVFASTLV